MQHGGGRPMVAATLVLLAWNMFSWVPEVLLLRRAQRCCPALAIDPTPAKQAAKGAAAEAHSSSGSGSGGGVDTGGGVAAGGSLAQRLVRPLRQQLAAWALYAQQPAAAAALALALIYLTVM